MKQILDIILAAVLIFYIIVTLIHNYKTTKLDRRFTEIGKGLAEQNELLKRRNEVLETIFAGKLKELEEKYSIEEEKSHENEL